MQRQQQHQQQEVQWQQQHQQQEEEARYQQRVKQREPYTRRQQKQREPDIRRQQEQWDYEQEQRGEEAYQGRVGVEGVRGFREMLYRMQLRENEDGCAWQGWEGEQLAMSERRQAEKAAALGRVRSSRAVRSRGW